MGTGEFNAGGNPAMDWHPIQGGVEIFLVASCHGNRDKLRPDGPLGSYADFTLTVVNCVSSRTSVVRSVKSSMNHSQNTKKTLTFLLAGGLEGHHKTGSCS